MNNTKNILIIAAITSLLIMGTSVIPMQSYAGESKNTNDSKPSIKVSTESDKKSANQKLDQDNFCYRGNDDCQQANDGQQIVGKDNEANGFNDQSRNIQQQSATATQPPTPTPTQPPGPGPSPTILNVCKEVVNVGPVNYQPSQFIFEFLTPATPSTFQGANNPCTAVTVNPGAYTFNENVNITNLISLATSSSGGCSVFFNFPDIIITGTIAAGETQTCTITNTLRA